MKEENNKKLQEKKEEEDSQFYCGSRQQSGPEGNRPPQHNKFVDVILGMVIGFIGGIICYNLFVASSIGGWVAIILYLGLIIFFYAKGRNGIGLGMILVCLVPFVIVGGCFLLLIN